MANLAPSVLKARHFCGPTDSSGGASLGIMRTVNSSNISLNNLNLIKYKQWTNKQNGSRKGEAFSSKYDQN